MGRIVNNPVTSAFSGQFGEDIIFRQIGGKAFFAKKGLPTKKKPSAAQSGNRSQFAQAQYYAKWGLYHNDELNEWYSIMAKVNGLKSAQVAAVKDFMTRPEINNINTSAYKGDIGTVIKIFPKILLKITQIDVTIYAGDGTVVESGSATRRDLAWKYTTTAVNPHLNGTRIELVAYDRLKKSCVFREHIYDETKTTVASPNRKTLVRVTNNVSTITGSGKTEGKDKTVSAAKEIVKESTSMNAHQPQERVPLTSQDKTKDDHEPLTSLRINSRLFVRDDARTTLPQMPLHSEQLTAFNSYVQSVKESEMERGGSNEDTT